jgi:hypothetical protein
MRDRKRLSKAADDQDLTKTSFPFSGNVGEVDGIDTNSNRICNILNKRL